MTPERWAQIEDLFHRAAECEVKDRTRLLDEACNGDAELRREVEALLSSEEIASDHVQAVVRDGIGAAGFPLVGETVSHYRILDGLGGGGMGLVYRAEDVKLGRQVALKFLPEESVKDPAALGRFEREARSASALEHANICPIYEFGEHEGRPFLVMPLLEGQTLRELILSTRPQKPPLELPKLLDLAIQITEGLDAAHRHGIIHRDIKPANIFVTREGQAKILDFGLAKLALGEMTREEEESELAVPGKGQVDKRARETPALTTPDPFLSRTGVAMGTAGYMSPEQARGEKLDPRTDLFSFGLVLFEMSTGQRAFKGDTGPVLHDAILKQIPTLARRLNPELPAGLEKIIYKALEKGRDARYQSASELAADLKNLNQELQPKTRAARWLGAAAAVVAVCSIAIAAWRVNRSPVSSALPDLKLQQLTANSPENPLISRAISPDGKYLAYADVKGMHIMVIGEEGLRSVPEPDGLKNDQVTWGISSWFPDSTKFVANAHSARETLYDWYSQRSSVWLVSVLGGPPTKLRDRAIAYSVSPDSSSISFGTNDDRFDQREIWLMGPNGEQARKILDASEDSGICCLHFFPDGKRVWYKSTDDSGESTLSRDLKGGPVTTLITASDRKKMGEFTWLPDGRLIYTDPCDFLRMRSDSPCNYWIKRLNTFTGEVIEKPRLLTNWVGSYIGAPSVTADGKRAAFSKLSRLGTGYMADLEAGGTRLTNSRPFPAEAGGESIVNDWSADSKTVIVSRGRGNHYSLFKQSLNSDTQEPIVTSAAGGLEDAWMSPDGKWIIAQVQADGPDRHNNLMRIPFTGGSAELIFTMPEWTSIQCLRPPFTLCAVAEQTSDHKQMVITSFDPIKGRGLELARLDLSPIYETSNVPLFWSISPDDARLATAPGPEGPIQIRSLRGRLVQTIRPKGLNPLRALAWTPDGKGLFVNDRTTTESELHYMNFQGDIRLLRKCSGDQCLGVPSPDGRHLAIFEEKQDHNIWMMENF